MNQPEELIQQNRRTTRAKLDYQGLIEKYPLFEAGTTYDEITDYTTKYGRLMTLPWIVACSTNRDTRDEYHPIYISRGPTVVDEASYSRQVKLIFISREIDYFMLLTAGCYHKKENRYLQRIGITESAWLIPEAGRLLYHFCVASDGSFVHSRNIELNNSVPDLTYCHDVGAEVCDEFILRLLPSDSERIELRQEADVFAEARRIASEDGFLQFVTL